MIAASAIAELFVHSETSQSCAATIIQVPVTEVTCPATKSLKLRTAKTAKR
ncbi:hypothetical protein [Nocardia africana]|uniref:Uncharacterized protein n=1 Tax=Nocardia africana TaxID=134964 RepID=A0ABW6NCJ3_9NOCA